MGGRRGIVLLSGGLDSATVAAIARSRGFSVHALSFDYGQRHRVELEAAARVAASLGVERHLVLRIDLGAFGGSALTAAEIPVPRNRPPEAIGQGIPVTYVPARNTVFLSLALAWAEVLEAPDIFIGVNALDYSGYPDCRPEFIRAFEEAANLGTKMGTEGMGAEGMGTEGTGTEGTGRRGGRRITIHTPLIAMTKREIIQAGAALGVDYGLTITCYDPSESGVACGTCDACLLRLRGFSEAGAADPARYSSG